MKKVEIYSNWCYMDQLDGKTLEFGEKIKVKWPNGSITKETVVVENSSYQISDHGSPWTVHVSKAFIQKKIKGVNSLIRLAEEDLLCERI